jgi:hypothetical protein
MPDHEATTPQRMPGPYPRGDRGPDPSLDRDPHGASPWGVERMYGPGSPQGTAPQSRREEPVSKNVVICCDGTMHHSATGRAAS